jgi:hypothetical protein
MSERSLKEHTTYCVCNVRTVWFNMDTGKRLFVSLFVYLFHFHMKKHTKKGCVIWAMISLTGSIV